MLLGIQPTPGASIREKKGVVMQGSDQTAISILKE